MSKRQKNGSKKEKNGSLKVSAKRTLITPLPVKPIVLGDLIGSVLTRAKQKKLQQLYAAYQGPIEDFWSALRNNPGFKSHVADLQFTLQLAALTRNHPPLVQALQQMQKSGNVTSIRDLAKMNAADWLNLIHQRHGRKIIGVPANTPGNNDAEKAKNYAQELATTIETAFPTATVVYRLIQENSPDQKDLATFFTNSLQTPGCPELDFHTTRIDQYLTDNAKVVLAGIADPAGLKTQLQHLQRVFKLTSRYPEMQVLMAGGLRSSQGIRQMGHGSFIAEYSGKLGGQARAEDIFQRADQISATALNLLAQYGPVFNQVNPDVTPSAPVPSPEDLPDWTNLFGSLDFCACEECRSVYSPAAYLVDLLAFLGRSPKTNGKSAKDVLLDPHRRSDIAGIELSCANTNVPVPYIDLVMEILENAVCPLPPNTPQPQTQGTADELSAEPEYVNAGAYNVLNQPDSVYPWSLPFDRWAAESRVYLENLGAERFQLLEALYPLAQPGALTRAAMLGDLAIARAYLGFTEQEAKIITGDAANPIWEFWGYGAGTVEPGAWISEVSSVPEFLRRSGLSYQELLELLATRFVNPDPQNPAITLVPADSCDLEKMTITNLSRPILDSIHRFVRLQRKLGWPILELDLAASVLPRSVKFGQFSEPPNVAWMVQLSLLKRLRDQFTLPLAKALSWWASISTAAYAVPGMEKTKSLYDQLFQNKTLLGSGTELTNFALQNLAQQIFGEHIPTLTAVLGISETELSALMDDAHIPSGSPITLAHLSELYRRTLLARTLKLSIKDFLAAQKLIGIDPFEPAHQSAYLLSHTHPENILLFVEKVSRIRASRFSLSQLNYIYQHLSDPDQGIAPQPATLATLIDGLVAGFIQIANETLASQPTQDTLQKKLAMLLDSQALGEVAVFLDKIPADISASQPTNTKDNQDFINLHFGPFLPLDAQTYAALLEVPLPNSEIELIPGNDDEVLYKQVVTAKADAIAHYYQTQSIAYLLGYLLPFLQDSLSRALVKNTLSKSLKLDQGTTELLLEQILTSRADPQKTAMADYLELGNLGLFAEYYAGPVLAGNPIQAMDPMVNFTWGAQAPAPGLDPLSFSARWTGGVLAPLGETFTFSLRTNSGVRLWLDNTLVIDQWGNQDIADYNVNQPLAAGQIYAIKLEYQNASANAVLQLSWSSPSTKKIFIPQARLFPEEEIYSAFRDAFTLLDKAALLVNHFQMTAKEIQYLSGHGQDFSGVDPQAPADLSKAAPFDLNALPLQAAEFKPACFNQWERLQDFYNLRDSLPASTVDLIDVFLAAPADLADALDKLASATGWDSQALTALTSQDLKNEAVLARLSGRIQLCQQLGITLPQLVAWGGKEPDLIQAQEIKSALKSRYDEDQWLGAAKALKDPLRETQRSALVDYLLANPACLSVSGLKDSDDLYAHLLIDVDMGAGQMTSRIKQAISTVQLFVQRCLMNLESEARLDAEAAKEWGWMKNYRVWEANRKVFLYPENWVEPDLRDDKSPFFKELENEILQSDITADSAETAYLNYLDKLDTVAHLEICGLYRDLGMWGLEEIQLTDEEKPETNVIHVFGRTRGVDAHTYYYRRLVDGFTWTPWEKIDLDIQGEHLIPVVFNRRLRLFWPIFEKKDDGQYWQIKLAWSEYRNGKWSGKKTSSGSIRTMSNHQYDQKQYTFFVDYTVKYNFGNGLMESLTIFSYENPQSLEMHGEFCSVSTAVGYFSLVGCHDQINYEDFKERFSGMQNLDPYNLFVSTYRHQYQPPQGADYPGMHEYMKFVEGDQDQLAFRDYASGLLANYNYTLGQTPGTFRVLFPSMYGLLEESINNWLGKLNAKSPNSMPSRQAFTPFFYEDEKNTFYVDPKMAWTSQGVLVDPNKLALNLDAVIPTELRYHFSLGYHPYSCQFIGQLHGFGIEGLLNPAYTFWQRQLASDSPTFANDYLPSEVVGKPYPVNFIDFYYGAYAAYNWEIFFHIPFLLADRLMKNQRFEEARQWFHYIFDPTCGADPEAEGALASRLQVWLAAVLGITNFNDTQYVQQKRFWKVQPFFINAFDHVTIQQMMRILADTQDPAPAVIQARKILEYQVTEWRQNPFNPHLIARMRITPYQKTIVMKYLDNLIGWGDQLFHQDTMEAINEATQLYILAAKILGPRPDEIYPSQCASAKTFAQLEPSLDAFSNALVTLENRLPSLQAGGHYQVSPTVQHPWLNPVTVLYFCIPKNEELLKYWDTIADRLFKIRHCMNIDGVVRELPLFEPPINPALLVKAVAAGVDIASILSDLRAPLPLYRFQIMLPKATELANELKTLGASLLAALEKQDAENLAQLRSGLEINLLEMVTLVKQQEITELAESLKALNFTRAMANERFNYYNNRDLMNAWETGALVGRGTAAASFLIGALLEPPAAAAHLGPDSTIGTAGPYPVAAAADGGSHVGHGGEAAARGFKDASTLINMAAEMAAVVGGYVQRRDDWNLQARIAQQELNQIDQQIAAAETRKAIAEQELTNHNQQIENAKTVDSFMQDKYTNAELYSWMTGQISATFFQGYQLAYDLAKRAERCYGFELGLEEMDFIQFGYWDSLRKGLLSGEKLFHDLKRMEMSYLEQNKREYEITKHISLAALNPLALVTLKETGQCYVDLPELLFDMDYPGHYMRRIKSAGLTIPCVTGPYTSVNCTLTLLKSSIRKSALGNPYPRNSDENGPVDDGRFVDSFGAIQSIATSSGQNDSGMFELNFRDERYLPFEGAGAISRWRLDMPQDCNAFDFNTIPDVILHLRYTAREGGASLQMAARNAVQALISDAAKALQMRFFSACHEFPNAWHQFLYPKDTDEAQNLALDFGPERFPFIFRGKEISITKIELFLRFKELADPQLNASPLAVYQKAGPARVLKVFLNFPKDSPSAGNTMLPSIHSYLAGLPHGVITLGTPPSMGTWLLTVKNEDIALVDPALQTKQTINGKDYVHLKAEFIDDIYIVCHYSAG
jgi:hypothetical protein